MQVLQAMLPWTLFFLLCTSHTLADDQAQRQQQFHEAKQVMEKFVVGLLSGNSSHVASAFDRSSASGRVAAHGYEEFAREIGSMRELLSQAERKFGAPGTEWVKEAVEWEINNSPEEEIVKFAKENVTIFLDETDAKGVAHFRGFRPGYVRIVKKDRWYMEVTEQEAASLATAFGVKSDIIRRVKAVGLAVREAKSLDEFKETSRRYLTELGNHR